MSKAYGVVRAYKELERKLEERVNEYFPLLAEIADLIRAKPVTVLLYFLSECVEDANCRLELANLFSKHAHLLARWMKSMKKISKVMNVVEKLLEKQHGREETLSEHSTYDSEAYEHLASLLRREAEEAELEYEETEQSE